MKSKTTIILAIITVLVYLYFSDYFFTINIYDTYYLISYFYVGTLVAILIGLYYLIFSKKLPPKQ